MLEFTLKQQGKIKRLTNQTFQLDQRYKDGFFSAAYFLKTEEIIKEVHPNNLVTVQFFQRKHSILCGIDEAIALIHTFAKNPQDLYIEALNDGDEISPLEPVLKITGRYQDFGFLEGPIDGILARRTSVASNCHRILQAAAGVPSFFLAIVTMILKINQVMVMLLISVEFVLFALMQWDNGLDIKEWEQCPML